jgi:hypothetical protein
VNTHLEFTKDTLERHAELVEASLPLHQELLNGAIEMLRQAQHDRKTGATSV